MKKLIYSALGVALIACVAIVSCKPKDGGGGDGGVKSKPKIAFQTNTGTYSGYTFADDKIQVGTWIKVGAIITSDVNLKSTHMTVKAPNRPDSMIGTDSLVSSKNCNRDYYYKLPNVKGKYVITIHATDKDATTSTATITITAFGPLNERGDFRFYSLKATSVDHFSAFDLNLGEAITASVSAGNEAQRDMEDMSTTSTLLKSWRSRNGTEFIMSGIDGKIAGKTYLQFQSEDDLKNAWNAASGKTQTLTDIDLGMLILARSTNGGTEMFYLIGITDVHDETGADNDYYDFQYKN